jgi:DNA polymerase-3 subunit gamma/tau
MANLGRAWQMIVKGLKEVQTSLTPIQAVEMILVRLAYLSDLPSPNDVIRNLEKYRDHPEGAVTPTNGQNKSTPSTLSSNTSGPGGLAFEIEEQPEKQTLSNFKLNNFEQVIALLDDHGERILMADLVNNVHLVSFEPGKIEVRLAEAANPDTPKRLYSFLNSVMEERWSVSVATQGGNPTLKEQKREEEKA